MEPESTQPFRRVREILNDVLGLHLRAVAQYKQHLSDRNDPRARAVLSHLHDSEQALAAALARYEQGGDDVLDTVVQGVPAAPLERAEAAGTASMDIETMLECYRQRGQALVQFFEQLAGSVGPRAQAIFADFAEHARREQQRQQNARLDF